VSATVEGRRERGRTELKESKNRGEKREKERGGDSKAVCILSSIPVRSSLDRAEIWTGASRHITLHSERLD